MTEESTVPYLYSINKLAELLGNIVFGCLDIQDLFFFCCRKIYSMERVKNMRYTTSQYWKIQNSRALTMHLSTPTSKGYTVAEYWGDCVRVEKVNVLGKKQTGMGMLLMVLSSKTFCGGLSSLNL